jgi:peptidoglycan/xylan/chitin deacetylase (PgdA/CDA1 family)
VTGGSRERDVLVLGYHAVSETWPAALSVTPADLRRQLTLLLARGYVGSTLHDALTADGSHPTLVVTFDDAYRSVLELAYPVLESLRVPATIFVVTDFADDGRELEWPGIAHWRDTPHRGELRGLGWSDLEELVNNRWEVGSHTRTHPRLTQLDDEALDRELRESREACERSLGRPCRSLAYPYGDFDARVVRAAASAGYEAAVIEGLARPSMLAWPRVGVYRKNSMLAFRMKVSPTLGRLRTSLGSNERARSALAATAGPAH